MIRSVELRWGGPPGRANFTATLNNPILELGHIAAEGCIH